MKFHVIFVASEISVVNRGSWTPVIGEFIEENIYKIINKIPILYSNNWKTEINNFEYDEDFDDWEFLPGDYVKCEWFIGSSGLHLKAIEKVEYKL